MAKRPEDIRAGGVRVAHPLFHVGDGGSTPTPALSASDLFFRACDKMHAVTLCRKWHSRLPNTQAGPWQFAFCAEHHGVTYAVALWNNPSTRSLPAHWLEMRRMACAPDAPANTASRFLSWMVRYFKKNTTHRERCISYQDTSVHSGTIYRAAGWHIAYVGVERQRDRSKVRVGTGRMYRRNINGDGVDKSSKVRWEREL